MSEPRVSYSRYYVAFALLGAAGWLIFQALNNAALWGHVTVGVLVLGSIAYRIVTSVPQPRQMDRSSAPDGAKNIVLFSDGTGNSSSNPDKTNVWRLYQMLDLGPNRRSRVVQVASYYNGVGTSSWRVAAILGSVFGIGLRDNVLELYRNLCRNYAPGDRIYAFGFSRGAFTIRMLVALIASQGVITDYADERELQRKSVDAYRRFRRHLTRTGFRPLYRIGCLFSDIGRYCYYWMEYRHVDNEADTIDFQPGWLPVKLWGRLWRGVQRLWASLHAADAVIFPRLAERRRRLFLWLSTRLRKVTGRRPQALKTEGRIDIPQEPDPLTIPEGAHDVQIEFVGLWDTVAAYGGPFSELTHAWDKWVYPLNMGDYILSPKVKNARHALAIDDERASFWPLVWDEVGEEEQVRAGKTKPGRIRQVWFTGMHADVGGGYPDHSLSYVSLIWMIDEIRKAERLSAREGGAGSSLAPSLKFIESEIERYRNLANAFGPLHNSRSALGAYYRYQPRNMEALLHFPSSNDSAIRRTLALRDPLVWSRRVDRGRPRGLLKSFIVHESVLVRINRGTDNYAPIALPSEFEIEPWGRLAAGQRTISLKQEEREALTSAIESRPEQWNMVWDLVWQRRLVYFLSLILTGVLIGTALFQPAWLEIFSADGRWLGDEAANATRSLVSGTFAPIFDLFVKAPMFVVLMVFFLVGTNTASLIFERKLRDAALRNWWNERDPIPAGPKLPPFWRKLRQSDRYQQALHSLKWNFWPPVLGIAMTGLIVWALWIATVQATLGVAERSSRNCSVAEDIFDGAKASCFKGAIEVIKNKNYLVVVAQRADWRYHGTRVANGPNGLAAVPKDATWSNWFRLASSAPMRRLAAHRWLQMAYRIRSKEIEPAAKDKGLRRWFKSQRDEGTAMHVDALHFAERSCTGKRRCHRTWVARLRAPISGKIAFFLNDASAIPGTLGSGHAETEALMQLRFTPID